MPILATVDDTAELTRLRLCRTLLQAAYSKGGAITRVTVKDILDRTKG